MDALARVVPALGCCSFCRGVRVGGPSVYTGTFHGLGLSLGSRILRDHGRTKRSYHLRSYLSGGCMTLPCSQRELAGVSSERVWNGFDFKNLLLLCIALNPQQTGRGSNQCKTNLLRASRWIGTVCSVECSACVDTLQADSSGKLSCALKSSFKPCQTTSRDSNWFCQSVRRPFRGVGRPVCLCLSLSLIHQLFSFSLLSGHPFHRRHPDVTGSFLHLRLCDCFFFLHVLAAFCRLPSPDEPSPCSELLGPPLCRQEPSETR